MMNWKAVLFCGGLGLGCAGSTYAPPMQPAEPSGSSAQGLTVHLTAAGVDNHTLRLAAGATLTFTNDDSTSHQIASNPHPAHTDCPELNGPSLSPGQSFTATLSSHRASCGFHDHLNPLNATLQGSIEVTAGAAADGGATGSGGGGGSPYP